MEIEQQYEDNLRWLAEADKHKLVVGSQAQYIYLDSKLLALFVCFPELIWTSLWAVWAKQYALYSVHLISAQTWWEGIKCIKAKE